MPRWGWKPDDLRWIHAPQSGVNRGGVEELKGANGGVAEELTVLDRGRRGRLGGTSRDAEVLEVDRTNSEGRHREIISSSSSNQTRTWNSSPSRSRSMGGALSHALVLPLKYPLYRTILLAHTPGKTICGSWVLG